MMGSQLPIRYASTVQAVTADDRGSHTAETNDFHPIRERCRPTMRVKLTACGKIPLVIFSKKYH
jgi:hypothetical protein